MSLVVLVVRRVVGQRRVLVAPVVNSVSGLLVRVLAGLAVFVMFVMFVAFVVFAEAVVLLFGRLTATPSTATSS